MTAGGPTRDPLQASQDGFTHFLVWAEAGHRGCNPQEGMPPRLLHSWGDWRTASPERCSVLERNLCRLNRGDRKEFVAWFEGHPRFAGRQALALAMLAQLPPCRDWEDLDKHRVGVYGVFPPDDDDCSPSADHVRAVLPLLVTDPARRLRGPGIKTVNFCPLDNGILNGGLAAVPVAVLTMLTIGMPSLLVSRYVPSGFWPGRMEGTVLASLWFRRLASRLVNSQVYILIDGLQPGDVVDGPSLGLPAVFAVLHALVNAEDLPTPMGIATELARGLTRAIGNRAFTGEVSPNGRVGPVGRMQHKIGSMCLKKIEHGYAPEGNAPFPRTCPHLVLHPVKSLSLLWKELTLP